jgi:TATA-box binding protein (TBP) (component of TFIID and TFIIIB)
MNSASPEVTLQSAKGIGTVPLGSLIRIVDLPEIESIVGYSGGLKSAPTVQVDHKEIIGNPSASFQRVVVKLKSGAQAIFHKKTIVISGKGPWSETAKVLGKLSPIVKGVHFEVTNTTVRWQLHRRLQLDAIDRKYGKNSQYNPETFAGLILTIRNPLVTLTLFNNGVVIASGKDLTGIKKRVQDELSGFIGAVNIGHQEPARKNLKGKREGMRNARYPVVNWNASDPGYYVKPGPNRRPRQYKIPGNPKLAIAKVRKAYANAGVQIPAATRRALGMSPLQSPPKRVAPPTVYSPPKKSAASVLNWNANKNGYYIKPGPGGLPKFYKVPKGVKAAKKTVLKAYEGRRIPNKVRQIFDITNANLPKVVQNVRNIKKDCSRFTVVQLRAILKERGIAYSGLTKDKMCARLNQVQVQVPTKKAALSPNFTLNGVQHYVLRNTKQIQRGVQRAKKLDSFAVKNLRGFANRLGGAPSKASKANLIKIILTGKRKSPSSIGSSLNSFAKELEAQFKNIGSKNKTPSPNMLNARAQLMFSPQAAREFATYYRLQGKKFPQNMNRIVANFKALKLKEQLAKYKGNVEIM